MRLGGSAGLQRALSRCLMRATASRGAPGQDPPRTASRSAQLGMAVVTLGTRVMQGAHRAQGQDSWVRGLGPQEIWLGAQPGAGTEARPQPPSGFRSLDKWLFLQT